VELELNGHTYIVGQMKSRQQRNVLRRVLPLIVASKSLLTQVSRALGEMADMPSDTNAEVSNVDELFNAAGPLAEALSSMPDEQFDYIFDTCLAVVRRRVAGGLVDIVIASGELRFEDIKLAEQLQLIFAVIKENYSDFLGGLPGLSSARAAALPPAA